jgi:GYF domain 2
MPDRFWFFAAEGKQQGPYPEPQFRELLARGSIRADTLVWTEGMANWQRAGEVPGLLSGAAAPPVMTLRGGAALAAGRGGGALSIDFGIWDFTWRSFLLFLGLVFLIPAPWVLTWYIKWFVSQVHVPGRPNLSFTVRASIIAAWYFGALVLAICVALTGVQWLDNLMGVVQLVLYWLLLRYFVANLASNEQPLGLSFSGSVWACLGWTLLGVISILSIIGWAWVYAAQMRWVCRNIEGTRHEVVFKGTGLEYLWRLIAVGLASVFIIPIPWMVRWLMRWQLSQTELVPRSVSAAAA